MDVLNVEFEFCNFCEEVVVSIKKELSNEDLKEHLEKTIKARVIWKDAEIPEQKPNKQQIPKTARIFVYDISMLSKEIEDKEQVIDNLNKKVGFEGNNLENIRMCLEGFENNNCGNEEEDKNKNIVFGQEMEIDNQKNCQAIIYIYVDKLKETPYAVSATLMHELTHYIEATTGLQGKIYEKRDKLKVSDAIWNDNCLLTEEAKKMCSEDNKTVKHLTEAYNNIKEYVEAVGGDEIFTSMLELLTYCILNKDIVNKEYIEMVTDQFAKNFME